MCNASRQATLGEVEVATRRTNKERSEDGALRPARPWQRGKRGRPTRPPWRTNIAGTRTSTSAELTSAQCVLDIYVGGCGLDSDEANLNGFCEENGVTIKKSQLLQTTSQWCKAYKITADADSRDSVLDAGFWPQGIYVRKLFNARNARISNYLGLCE